MDTGELIREARLGSAAAQKCLYDLYASKLNLLCQRYLRSSQDAEEAMLDGFYKFFSGLNNFQYRDDAATYAWLKRIAINECLIRLRRKSAFTIVTGEEVPDIPLPEEALDQLSAKEIFNLVVQLPPGYRTIFNLYAIEGLPHGEIAGLLGISEGTSKSQLSKAKALLQKNLTHYANQYAQRNSR